MEDVIDDHQKFVPPKHVRLSFVSDIIHLEMTFRNKGIHAFIEGKVRLKGMLPARAGDTDSEQKVAGAIIIPDHGSIFGDQGGAPAPDLLGGGLDQLLARGHPERTAAAASKSLLGYIFGMGGAAPVGFVPPKHVWLSLVSNIIHFEMTFRNKVMQGFGIQLNKNIFGMVCTQPLCNPPVICCTDPGHQSVHELQWSCPEDGFSGSVQKMDPLTNVGSDNTTH